MIQPTHGDDLDQDEISPGESASCQPTPKHSKAQEQPLVTLVSPLPKSISKITKQEVTESQQSYAQTKGILNDIESFSQGLLTQLSASAHPIRKEIELRYCLPTTPLATSVDPLRNLFAYPKAMGAGSTKRDSDSWSSLNSAPETASEHEGPLINLVAESPRETNQKGRSNSGEEEEAIPPPLTTISDLLMASSDSIGTSYDSVDGLNTTKTPAELQEELRATLEQEKQQQQQSQQQPAVIRPTTRLKAQPASASIHQDASSPNAMPMSLSMKNAMLPKVMSVADYTLSITESFPERQGADSSPATTGGTAPLTAGTTTATTTPAQSHVSASHYHAMTQQHIQIYTLMHRLYQECLQQDCLREAAMNTSDSSNASSSDPAQKWSVSAIDPSQKSGSVSSGIGPLGGGPKILQRPPPLGISEPKTPPQLDNFQASPWNVHRQSKAFANGGPVVVDAASGIASFPGTPTASFRLGANSMRRLVSFGARSNGFNRGRDSIQEGALSLAEFQVVESKYHPGEDDAGFETINNYAIIEELGRGNFGKVMLACDEEGNQVAIKSMSCGVKAPKHRFGGLRAGSQSGNASLAGSMQSLRKGAPSMRKEVMAPQVETMVMREVAIMKKLRHKNIVQLKEVIHDEEDDMCHLVMDYISGGPLAEVSKDGSCISTIKGDIKLAKEYICQAAAGLEYLHRQGIVHRDVKPENLLIGSDRDCYIADFGVSAVMRDDKVVDISAGTQTFFSPELVKGDYENASKYGKQSDVWALGATFYALVYEKVPFYAPNLMALATAILHDPVTFPDDVAPDDEVRVIISGLLHKDPGKRWTLRRLRHTLDGRRPVRQRQDANDMESSDRPANQGDADPKRRQRQDTTEGSDTDSQNSRSDASPWGKRPRRRMVERVRKEVSKGATPKEELPLAWLPLNVAPSENMPSAPAKMGGASGSAPLPEMASSDNDIVGSDASSPLAETDRYHSSDSENGSGTSDTKPDSASPDGFKPKSLPMGPRVPTPPEGGLGMRAPPRVRGSYADESIDESDYDSQDDIGTPTEEEIFAAVVNSRVSFFRPVLAGTGGTLVTSQEGKQSPEEDSLVLPQSPDSLTLE